MEIDQAICLQTHIFKQVKNSMQTPEFIIFPGKDCQKEKTLMIKKHWCLLGNVFEMKYFHSQVLKYKKINDLILNKSYSRLQLFSLIYHNPKAKWWGWATPVVN